MKFATQEQSTKSLYRTYNTIEDAIIANVQVKYKFGTDMTKTIWDRKKIDINDIRPTHKIAKLTNAKMQAATTDEERKICIKQKQKVLNIEYKASVPGTHVYQTQVHAWREWSESISLILNIYCTKEMKNRI